MRIAKSAGLIAVVFALGGCQFHARGPEKYRQDTRSLLQTRSAEIQSCYETALKGDTNAGGTVVVHFTVAPDSGAIGAATVLPESTAPAALGECVVRALDGLALQPPDERQGDATFAWEFHRG